MRQLLRFDASGCRSGHVADSGRPRCGRPRRSHSSPMVQLLARSAVSPGCDSWACIRSRRPAMREPRSSTRPFTRTHRARTWASTVRFCASNAVPPGLSNWASCRLIRPATEAPVSRTCPCARISGAQMSSPTVAWLSWSTGSSPSCRAELGPFHEERPGYLTAMEPYRPPEPALRQPQPAVDPHPGRTQAGQHRLGQIEVGELRAREVGDLVEVALAQPDDTVHRRVLQIQSAGDPRARDLEGGDLALRLGSGEQQRPQHPCPYGPLRAPPGAVRHVLVPGGAQVHGPEVHRRAQGEGLPHPSLGRRQIVDHHHSGLSPETLVPVNNRDPAAPCRPDPGPTPSARLAALRPPAG